MKKIIKQSILAVALFAIAACSGGFRNTVGLRRDAPDEFRVVSNAPLSMPPEFTLRPPVPGAKRPQELNTEQQAKDILLDNPSSNKLSNESSGDSVFLKMADTQSADPEIKNVITQEALDAANAEKKKSFWSKLTSYGSSKPNKDSVVVADKEKDHIEENKKEAKPASDGDIAGVQPSSGGLLNNVFGF